MNFMRFPLHQQSAGTVIEATLSGVESDVFLVDPANLRSFELGQSFQYYGGHYNQSPIRLRVPRTGDWTAVVVPGTGGMVRASVRVLASA
jgi:hypothetical protein